MTNEELQRFIEVQAEYEDLDFKIHEQALKMLKQINIKNYGINDIHYIQEKKTFTINYSIFCGEYCDEYITFKLEWFSDPNWIDDYNKMIEEKKRLLEEQKELKRIEDEKDREIREYQLFIRLKEKYENQ